MPKRIPLITPFVTVCKEGMTIDGREVKAEWLKEVAETYSRELRSAPIDAEHFLQWFGRFGTVDAVRAGTNSNGETILEAKLEPNMRMLEQNSRGQRLNTSVHITKDNSPVPGKWYLVGLALTDNPAVNTTTELKFCSEDANEHILRNGEFDSLVFLDNKEDFSTEELSTFKKLMLKMGFSSSANDKKLTHNQNEGKTMDKVQYDAMLAAQGKTAEALLTLTATIGNSVILGGAPAGNQPAVLPVIAGAQPVAGDQPAVLPVIAGAQPAADQPAVLPVIAGAQPTAGDQPAVLPVVASAPPAAVTPEQLAVLQASAEQTNKAIAALTSTIQTALKLPGTQNTEFGDNVGGGAADILY